MSDKGVLTVISGFSGAGKGTVVKQLLDKYDYGLSISATTRSPREGEQDGREYFFKTKEEFEQYKKMFNDYVRGGVEELYEQLIIRKADPDDKFRDNRTANLMALMTRYGAGKMNVIPENEDETVRIQI